MLVKRVCIVGMGLMGGSFALALRLAQRVAVPRFSLHLTLVDKDPDTLASIQYLGDEVTAVFADGIAQADLVILATPVRSIQKLVHELARLRPDGCMVMDLGSSKVTISEAMEALPDTFHAIGGHPMCGKETSGFGSATPDLYRDKLFILCRNGRTTHAIETQAQFLLELIGANMLMLPPSLHDKIVASVSHLPYLVSAVLMRNAAAMNDDQIWPISATGFQDTSRVSGTDPTMMLDILLTNKTAVLVELEKYQAQLTAVQHLVAAADETALRDWLRETQGQYFTYRSKK
ncbi:MAG: prephenate dehydrogenase [Chloroflexi bacterium]|nr:prephenate dehydrogenase [Chloroflexota bacterium]